MKKCLSLLLTLAMVLSMVPAAFAAEDDAVELSTDPVVLTEDEIEVALEEEARAIRHADAEINAAEEIFVAELPETAALGASRTTIKGTVTFPAAYTGFGDNIIRVYAVMPAVTDETGRVIQEPGYYGGHSIELDKGDTSASYELSVPAGEYSLAIYNYADIGVSRYSYTYFNGDGTLAANDYVAKTADFTSGGTINLTIPKAERTISGKLEFSEPLSEDIHVYVYGYEQSRYGEGRIDTYLEAKKGAQSVDFSFPVNPGTYPLQFSAHRGGYADIYGGVSDDYNSRAYFNVEAESISGIVINGDYILERPEEEERSTHEIQVDITLPEPTKQWEQYMVFLWNANNPNEPWDYNTCSVDKNGSTISTSFWVEDGFQACVSYIKCTNWSNMSWTSAYPSNRFLGENGTTWNRDEAAIFPCEGEDITVTFNDTNNYKVTGKLTIPAAESDEFIAYAMVNSGDISFGDRVIFYQGQTEAEFTVYVPTAYAGNEFTVSGYRANGRTIFLNDASCVAGDTFTLNGDKSVSSIMLAEAVPTVAGTFSLPAGVTAPAEGLAVQFNCESSHSVYIMPAGSSSIDYVLYSSLPENEDGISVSAEILNAPDSLFPGASTWFELDDVMDADLSACEAVTLSGTVTVPVECADGASSFEIECNSDDLYTYTYLTVLPGKTSASFSMPVPKNSSSRIYTYLRGDSTGVLLSSNVYLQPDGSTSTENTNVVLTEDITADFLQERGSIITGTITFPVEGYYEGRVYAEPTEGGTNYRSPNFQFDGTEFTYKLAVPVGGDPKVDSAYRIRLSLSEAPAGVMTDRMYYSEEGTVLKTNEASEVFVPDEGFTADFVVPRAKSVTGTVILPEGTSANNFEVNAYVWAISEEEENRYNNYVSFNGSTGSYCVNLPLEFNGVCMVGMRIYSYGDNAPSDLIYDTYLYLTADGGWTTSRDNAATFSITEDGLIQDMTVPTGITTKVTLNAPEGFSGYYEGELRLYPVAGGDNRNVYFDFEGDSTTLSFSALPGDTTEYNLRVYLYAGDGVMTDRSYYYAGDGAWVTDRDEATPITLGNGDLDLTMPSGKVIRGKLVAVDGGELKFDPDDCSLWLSGDSYLNTTYKFQEDGSFSITIPDDASGNYYLEISPSSRSIANIMEGNYYYAEGATQSCTDRDNATMIDVSGDIPELTVLVDTGYILSGTVELGEGTILTTSNDWNVTMGYVYLNLWDNTQNYQSSCTAYLESENTPWTYSFVVPKTEATYQLQISRVETNTHNSSITSNVFVGNYWNSGMEDLGTITVTGDAALPTVTLTNWYANTENLLFQSNHGFFHDDIDALPTYTYYYPVDYPQWVNVTFDQRTDVNLYINGRFLGTPNGLESVYVEDGTINITIDGDYYYSDQYFGFGITAISGNEPLDKGSFGAVFTGDTYDEAYVLPALDAGDEITVSLSGPTDETASVLAAIYDDMGKMIGLELVEVTFTNGSAVARVGFDNSAFAGSMKLMLLDDFFAPFATAKTYTR